MTKQLTQQEKLLEYLLRLADSNIILSQRLCELCGKAPALEEEMALMNVALDLVGQARNWYEYASELDAQKRDPDTLVYRRDAHEYRNLLLTEQPNGDYAATMARQFFYDVWHFYTLEALVASTDPRLAEVAAKALKEVTYHLRRSTAWMLRLGDGTAESHARMQSAVENLWRFTGEMLSPDALEIELAAQGLIAQPEQLAAAWHAKVNEVLTEATLTLQPADAWMLQGSKEGVHTEHLGFILAEMQFLPRAYPDAVTW